MRIRPIEPEDLDFIYRMENTPELWDCSETDAPYSRYALREYLQHLRPVAECGELRMVIETGPEPHFSAVGLTELTNISLLNARAEVGIAVEKSFRSENIGTRALTLLENIARRRLRLHMLYAKVGEKNNSALQFFLRAGYTDVATLPHWHFIDGKYESAHLLEKIL